MPPVVRFALKHVCANFPLCQKLQQKSGSDGDRQRSDHCSYCLASQPDCAFENCHRKAAPGTGRYTTDFCATHYGDPSNAASRSWQLCCNSKIGCRQLSKTPRSGKCFACSEGNFPCVHSMSGCPLHTRGSSKVSLSRRGACTSGYAGKCSFAPDNPRKCSTPQCGQPRVGTLTSFCSDCELRRFPCSRRCLRRCGSESSASELICKVCATPTSSRDFPPIHCDPSLPSAAPLTINAARTLDDPIPSCLNFFFVGN